MEPGRIEIERAILGTLLQAPKLMDDDCAKLAALHFGSKKHATIFTAMRVLYEQHTWFDLATLGSMLARQNGDSVGAHELAEIGSYAEYDGSIPTMVDRLITISTREGIMNLLSEHARWMKENPDLKSEQVLDEFERRVTKIVTEIKQGPESIGTILKRVVDDLEMRSTNPNKCSGVPSGFPDLDYITTGFQPGDLVVVAARPGMGKSAFALNLAVNGARATKRPVLVFSLEMRADELANRWIANESGVSLQKLRSAILNSEDWSRIVGSMILGELPILVNDSGYLGLWDIRAQARRLARHSGIGMLIIDYVQLMAGNNRGSREQEVAEFSRGLKAIAKELKIPIIALCQLNRMVETRGSEDRRPRLSDLRESGAIEQDADIVLMLYRDEYYNPNTSTPGLTEVLIRKHRNGNTGTFNLMFDAEQQRFRTAP